MVGYQPGDWYTFQCASADAVPSMVQTTQADAGSAAAFTGKVNLGLGWSFGVGHKLDLDAAVIAFDDKNKSIAVINFENPVVFRGAIKLSGDNLTGMGSGDDEVIKLNLSKMPPNVFRLACVVNCFSNKSLSSAKSAYVRLFIKHHTLCKQTLTKVCDSTGLFFCMLQRNATGAWFFQTIVKPVSSHNARGSVDDVRNILSEIPMF